MGQKYKLLGKEKEIISLFDTGEFTFKELSKKFNVSPPAMREYLNKRGRVSKSPNEVSRKYYINQNYFDNLDTQDKFYILGLLFADGCNIPKDNKIILSLKIGDEYLLQNINKILQHSKPLYKSEPRVFKQNNKLYNSSGHYKLTIISKKISKRLEELGIVANKSLITQFPSYIPKDMLRHFIRGYFDGDGGVTNGVSFIGTFAFVNKIKEILTEKLGINNTKILKHCKSNIYYYNFSWRRDLKVMYEYLYKNANLFLKRKKEKLYELSNCKGRRTLKTVHKMVAKTTPNRKILLNSDVQK